MQSLWHTQPSRTTGLRDSPLCVGRTRFVRRCRSFKNISSISTFRQRADKRHSHSRKYITEKGEKFGEIYFFFLPVRIIAIIYANSSRNFYTCRFTVYIANSSRRSCFGPMQKLFPLIKLPRQLSPGSGAFVSFSSLQRDRSMHNYNVKKK